MCQTFVWYVLCSAQDYDTDFRAYGHDRVWRVRSLQRSRHDTDTSRHSSAIFCSVFRWDGTRKATTAQSITASRLEKLLCGRCSGIYLMRIIAPKLTWRTKNFHALKAKNHVHLHGENAGESVPVCVSEVVGQEDTCTFGGLEAAAKTQTFTINGVDKVWIT